MELHGKIRLPYKTEIVSTFMYGEPKISITNVIFQAKIFYSVYPNFSTCHHPIKLLPYVIYSISNSLSTLHPSYLYMFLSCLLIHICLSSFPSFLAYVHSSEDTRFSCQAPGFKPPNTAGLHAY
jgi:hypothetical protein